MNDAMNAVNPAPSETKDDGKIRFGGSFRLPPVTPAPEVKDSGRIRTGGSFRLMQSPIV